jgi:hypothetical protein
MLLIGLIVISAGTWSSVLSTPPASAGAACPDSTRVFAVLQSTGHLTEIPACPSQSTLGPTAEVDAGDWRGYRQLFAAGDGAAVVLYAVTVDGELWWRRQPGPGAAFGAPVRVGSDVVWSRFSSIFVPQPGYLQAVATTTGSPVLTYRHDLWTTGGLKVVPEAPLLAAFAGPSMMAAQWGTFAEGVWAGAHYRVWRDRFYPQTINHDDTWYFSGNLPARTTSVTGTEPWLYGVSGAGSVVLLRQPTPPAPPGKTSWDCPRQNPLSWQVAASIKGGYQQVVVPIARFFAQSPSLMVMSVSSGGGDCPADLPYEWQ